MDGGRKPLIRSSRPEYYAEGRDREGRDGINYGNL